MLLYFNHSSYIFQREGADGADRAEREAMHRSHSQLPYFLGRPAQEHTVIKSGYCVKQGAVVSPLLRSCSSVGPELGSLCLVGSLRDVPGYGCGGMTEHFPPLMYSVTLFAIYDAVTLKMALTKNK